MNEGLTTFFQWYGMEAVREKSFVWQKFYEDTRRGALKNDWIPKDNQSSNSPLVPTAEWIKTDEEALSMFIPMWMRYDRGACMMAMLRSMLGDEILLPSITSYLTTYSFTNVVTRDLFEFLDKPAKKLGVVPVDSHLMDFMEPWVNRSGYPVVYIVRNKTSNTVWIVEITELIHICITVIGSCDPGENVLGERNGA